MYYWSMSMKTENEYGYHYFYHGKKADFMEGKKLSYDKMLTIWEAVQKLYEVELDDDCPSCFTNVERVMAGLKPSSDAWVISKAELDVLHNGGN